ncbi:MAG: DUF5615 family PIN-like protein [Hyphomicrobium sp.]
MKFLLDECLPHAYAKRLANRGYPDSVHPIHLGLRTAPDPVLVRLALAEDRIIITANADDFRTLLAREVVHAGLILFPNGARDANWRLLDLTISWLEVHLNPADYMVNRVIEVSATDGIRPYILPGADEPVAPSNSQAAAWSRRFRRAELCLYLYR